MADQIPWLFSPLAFRPVRPVVYLLVGFLLAPGNILFGILTHWVVLTIGFVSPGLLLISRFSSSEPAPNSHCCPTSQLLFLIGNSSLTALTDGTSCGNVGDAFNRCKIVKGLVVVS